MFVNEMQNYTKLEAYRGFSIMALTEEKPTKWCVRIRIGVHKNDKFIPTLPPIDREFTEKKSLFGYLRHAAAEEKNSIDKLALW